MAKRRRPGTNRTRPRRDERARRLGAVVFESCPRRHDGHLSKTKTTRSIRSRTNNAVIDASDRREPMGSLQRGDAGVPRFGWASSLEGRRTGGVRRSESGGKPSGGSTRSACRAVCCEPSPPGFAEKRAARRSHVWRHARFWKRAQAACKGTDQPVCLPIGRAADISEGLVRKRQYFLTWKTGPASRVSKG